VETPKPIPKARVLLLDGRTISCLPTIKALHLAGHEVSVAESDHLCPGFFSRFTKRRIKLRDLKKDPDGFLADLVGHLATKNYDILIPILDVTATLVCQHKGFLEQYVRIPLPDYPVFMRARDKSQTMKIAHQNGLPCPKTYFPEDLKIEKLARAVDYPVLIKPNIGVGARGLTKVCNSSELIGLYPKVVARYGPCSIQEFIDQTDLQYKAQIFIDRDKKVKGCVVYSKIRHYPLGGGVSTLNCTVARPDIAEIGIKLLQAMEWSSYGDIDLIADPRDGLVKIMEVNPRITGSIKICFESGVDFANMLVAYALGYEVAAVNKYRTGVYLRNLGMDLLWFLKSKQRFKANPSWFWFLGKNLKYEVFSFTDPGPVLGYLLANIRDLFVVETRRYKYQRGYLG